MPTIAGDVRRTTVVGCPRSLVGTSCEIDDKMIAIHRHRRHFDRVALRTTASSIDVDDHRRPVIDGMSITINPPTRFVVAHSSCAW